MQSDAYEPTMHEHRWAQKLETTPLLSFLREADIPTQTI